MPNQRHFAPNRLPATPVTLNPNNLEPSLFTDDLTKLTAKSAALTADHRCDTADRVSINLWGPGH